MKKFPLCELTPGDEAKIAFIPQNTELSRRLYDLGFTVGTPVKCELKAPFGDPAAYRIKGAVIALRNCDCEGIETEEVQWH